MKKIYTAPEAELLCFRPVEELALQGGVAMDNLLDTKGFQTAAKDGGASDFTFNFS
ncbi:MAG: hypothetical protein IJB02_05725 [Oscillospiraceae bacterium]|nr:hypothetical protein [Oscillospiraceae bacterium]